MLYDVPPWLEDDEVTALIKQLEAGLSVESITRVSWTLGNMPLSAWQIKGSRPLGLMGKVLRDEDTHACMYSKGERAIQWCKVQTKRSIRQSEGERQRKMWKQAYQEQRVQFPVAQLGAGAEAGGSHKQRKEQKLIWERACTSRGKIRA